MASRQPMLEGIATRLGRALAFAQDTSERQRRTNAYPLTRAASTAVARSFLIGDLWKRPIPGHQLLEQHTELNKVVVRDDDRRLRFWFKSMKAIEYGFDTEPQLLEATSSLYVLGFRLVDDEVEFHDAPIVRRPKSKRYMCLQELEFRGRYPLGGQVPPGGFDPDLASGLFEDDHDAGFDDLFGDDRDDEAGEEAG